MGCREIVELLGELVDKDLSDIVCESLNKQISECEECKVIYKTYIESIKLCRELGSVECFEECINDRLITFLRKTLNKEEDYFNGTFEG